MKFRRRFTSPSQANPRTSPDSEKAGQVMCLHGLPQGRGLICRQDLLAAMYRRAADEIALLAS